MKTFGTLVVLSLLVATTLSAGISMRQYSEIVLDEPLNATGRQYLTDIDGDGHLDILFDLSTKIGWYSGSEGVIKSSIDKKTESGISRAYALGYFDSDNEPDYVESVIHGSPLALNLVYFLSTDGFSGKDTVYFSEVSGYITTYDPYLSIYYFVIGPYVKDLDKDGIDEVYTGYFHYEPGCIIGSCLHTGTTEFPFSDEYGDSGSGTSAAVPSSYDLTSIDGSSQTVSLLISNVRDFGEFWGLGFWDKSPLEIATYDDLSKIGSVLLTSDALCLEGFFLDDYYTIGAVSTQVCDPRNGYSSASMLASVRLVTSSTENEYCFEEQTELLRVGLSATDSLPVLWREVAPEWATSDIIFADTSSPGQIFLSDGERIFQVREQSFEKLDSSTVENLSGHMIGYKKLVNGEPPSLVLSDGDRLKFFRFDIVTDVEDDTGPDGLPGEFTLNQNYPNPFNPSTSISFEIPQGSHVTLEIINTLGQSVTTLTDRFYPAGTHTIEWDGTDFYSQPVASGLYLYRLSLDGKASSKKMLLLK